MEEELEQVKQTLAQVCQDSKEIEEELELQIKEKDSRNAALEKEVADLRARLANAPNSAGSSDFEHENTELKHSLQSIETANDELEQKVRLLTSDVQNLSAENADLLERLALKESDSMLITEQQQAIERLRQELVEANEDIENMGRSQPDKKSETRRPFGARRSSRVEALIQPRAELRSKQWSSASSASSASNPAPN